MADGGFLADVERFPELATALTGGAHALDEAGTGIPDLPNAGESTPAVADAMGGMAEAIGLFVTAMAATGHGVGDSDRGYRHTDADGARRLPEAGENR